jgi:hypothetical protein
MNWNVDMHPKFLTYTLLKEKNIVQLELKYYNYAP